MDAIVNREIFPSVLVALQEPGSKSLDCEATGLFPYLGDRLFSLMIGNGADTFYFNFNPEPGLAPELVLTRDHLRQLGPLFSDAAQKWYLHNAKYDLALLYADGLELRGEIHCTQAIARVIRNDHLLYSLSACASRIGLQKSQAVDEYIEKQGLWEWRTIPGKKQREKKKFFDRVPYSVMVPYGLQDARLTHALGTHQDQELIQMGVGMASELPTTTRIAQLERRFTKTCFHMEKVGVRIDRAYCEQALQYEMGRYRKAAHEFEEMSGVPFKDSPKQLEKAFSQVGEKFPFTEKGNPSFAAAVLKGFSTPLAKKVLEYRDAYKRAHTYFQNFLRLSDSNDRIHANFRQGGTETGRISLSEPNLQNLPKRKDKDGDYRVRQAFIPEQGKILISIDYEQVEYRLMLDEAEELGLIRRIRDEGLDVHEATAQAMGVSRDAAKTLNFGLLYGAGSELLAKNLGMAVFEARRLKNRYFAQLPQVLRHIDSVTSTAELRGWVFNWAGRRCYCADKRYAYKIPNHRIQGGCADVMKFAMNGIDAFLEGRQTKMILQIHDELWFETVPDELSLFPWIVNLMETAYPYKHLPLTCSTSHSYKSAADLVDGIPGLPLD